MKYLRSKKNFLLSIFLGGVFFFVPKIALTKESNLFSSLCTPKTGIKSFKIKIINNPYSNIEFCQVDESHFPAQVKNVFNQIVSLHQSLADAYHLKVEELLYKSIKVEIIESIYGHAGSFSAITTGNNSSVEIAVFSDWNGEPINEGIYLHELGHVIVGMAGYDENPYLPFALKYFKNNFLFGEMIADLGAIHIKGHVFDFDNSLPACMQRSRDIFNFQSFQVATGYMKNDFWFRRDLMCCDYLDKTNTHTTHSKQICNHDRKMIKSYFPPDGKITRFDTTPLTLEFLRSPTRSQHQIGIPINSFFLDFKKVTGTDIFQIFLKALSNPGKNIPDYDYECKISRIPEFKFQTKVPSYTTKLFDEIKNHLPSSQKIIYEQLFKNHRMEFANQISELNLNDIAISNAITSGALPNIEPCFNPITKIFKTSINGCSLDCKKTSHNK